MKARVCAKNAVFHTEISDYEMCFIQSFKAYERHQNKSQINFETLNGKTSLNMQHKV